MARRDPLTGSLGREELRAALDAALVEARRARRALAVCVIDLDGFRMVNDVHGPDTGDRVLAAAADAMARRLRSTDAIGRVGSDEFAVILPRTNVHAARAVAEGLLGAIRALRVDDLHITASIGVAGAHPEATAGGLLAEAGGALLAAKHGGSDRVAVAGPGDGAQERARTSLSWATRIRQALETGGLELYAQPIVALQGRPAPLASPSRSAAVPPLPSSDGRSAGAEGGGPLRHELLVRLRTESGPPVLPIEFLAAAERFGQIQSIDGWVLGRALDLLVRTGASGPVLHVNLAPASVCDPELMSFVERAIVASGAAPSRLVFEITETAAIGDLPSARAAVGRLRALGCAIAIDDFGMGFGSFSHLKQIPFDVLKIAGEFVHDVTTSAVDRLTVEAVTHVARGMGMTTVAEYVGDDATVAALRELGIHYAQGFHTGEPRPVAEAWPG